MTWSISTVGRPAALKADVDGLLDNLRDQSREEFAGVAPHLKGLLDAADPDMTVALTAHGHANWGYGARPPRRTAACIAVDLKQLGPPKE